VYLIHTHTHTHTNRILEKTPRRVQIYHTRRCFCCFLTLGKRYRIEENRMISIGFGKQNAFIFVTYFCPRNINERTIFGTCAGGGGRVFVVCLVNDYWCECMYCVPKYYPHAHARVIRTTIIIVHAHSTST